MSLPATGPLAALDPGRCKCGLVLSDPARRSVREARVLPPEQVAAQLRAWHAAHPLAAVVIGDGTGSSLWRRRLADAWPLLIVDERGTTLAARRRYWQLHPPGLPLRLLPEGLRQPPRDWDDVVAQLLLERLLQRPLERLRSGPAP